MITFPAYTLEAIGDLTLFQFGVLKALAFERAEQK
jgi:hypothetical protein